MFKPIVKSFLMLLAFSAGLHAYSLTGVVRDVNTTLLGGAKIVLADMINTIYKDSTVTDSSGHYSFTGSTLSNYKLSISRQGYNPKDTFVLFGNADKVVNVSLYSISYHWGNVSGTWLPADNPHRILGRITVADSLYIAPGCSVIFDSSVIDTINAGLTVGKLNDERTFLLNSRLTCQADANIPKIKIENTTIEGYFNIHCQKIYIDSVLYKYGNIPKDGIRYVRFYADSSADIHRLTIDKGTGQDTVIGEFVTAYRPITVENCFFNNLKSVLIGYSAHAVIRYSVFNADIFYLYATAPRTIQHCNIQRLKVSGSLPFIRDSILVENNIIDQIYFYQCSGGDVYNSPFKNNIVKNNLAYNSSGQVFGLLSPVRTNRNNDSCDLWFNVKKDPLILDAATGLLRVGSPALHAANDSMNIGYYQGSGVSSIQGKPFLPREEKRLFFIGPNPFSIKNTIVFDKTVSADAVLLIYDLAGELVGEYQRLNDQTVVLDHVADRSGTYLAVLKTNGRWIVQKLVLIK